LAAPTPAHGFGHRSHVGRKAGLAAASSSIATVTMVVEEDATHP
jgi:hypothetical protein